jgi:hypothetical protein
MKPGPVGCTNLTAGRSLIRAGQLKARFHLVKKVFFEVFLAGPDASA